MPEKGARKPRRGGPGKGKGKPKKTKLPSIKNQIRGVQRLLAKKGGDPKVRQKQEERLQELLKSKEQHERAERERKFAKRYHKVRFFERVKIERRVQKLERPAGGGAPLSPEEQAELEQLREDLQYVLHFPKGEKYVSLLKDAPEPADQARLEAERARLRALVRQQLAEAALVAEADEGRSLARRAAGAAGGGGEEEEGPSDQEEGGLSEEDDFFLHSDGGGSSGEEEEGEERQQQGEGPAAAAAAVQAGAGRLTAGPGPPRGFKGGWPSSGDEGSEEEPGGRDGGAGNSSGGEDAGASGGGEEAESEGEGAAAARNRPAARVAALPFRGTKQQPPQRQQQRQQQQQQQPRRLPGQQGSGKQPAAPPTRPAAQGLQAQQRKRPWEDSEGAQQQGAFQKQRPPKPDRGQRPQQAQHARKEQPQGDGHAGGPAAQQGAAPQPAKRQQQQHRGGGNRRPGSSKVQVDKQPLRTRAEGGRKRRKKAKD